MYHSLVHSVKKNTSAGFENFASFPRSMLSMDLGIDA